VKLIRIGGRQKVGVQEGKGSRVGRKKENETQTSSRVLGSDESL
jgi:hypothetical protein